MTLKPFNPAAAVDGRTNGERVDRFNDAIREYAKAEPIDHDTIRDLLVDCLHWMHKRGWNEAREFPFGDLVADAFDNFHRETNQ